MRIKAFLVLDRNYTRDYVDFLALATPLEQEDIEAALSTLDNLYGQLAVAFWQGVVVRPGHGLEKSRTQGRTQAGFYLF